MGRFSVLSGIFLCILLSNIGLGSTDRHNTDDEKDNTSCGLYKSCVPSYLCSEDGTIIKDGRTVINMRTMSFKPKDNHGCEWTEKCCTDADKRSRRDNSYVSRGCGFSNPNGVEINLQNAATGDSQFGEFPWMVAVFQKGCSSNSNNIPQGGGVLLAPNVVLTIAHKIHNISVDNLIVRAGEWDSLTTAEPYPHEDRAVASRIIHPSFNKFTGNYDAALLILKTPFNLAPHIDTICLPTQFDDFNQSRCIVTGWGKKQIIDADYPNLLKKIDVPFVERSMCQNQLRQTRLGRYFELHNSFVCAGGEKNKDACIGDGGSPLFCPKAKDQNKYVLAGLVSWGIECGFEGVPGVYANVQLLRPWIDAQLKKQQISLRNLEQ